MKKLIALLVISTALVACGKENKVPVETTQNESDSNKENELPVETTQTESNNKEVEALRAKADSERKEYKEKGLQVTGNEKKDKNNRNAYDAFNEFVNQYKKYNLIEANKLIYSSDGESKFFNEDSIESLNQLDKYITELMTKDLNDEIFKVNYDSTNGETSNIVVNIKNKDVYNAIGETLDILYSDELTKNIDKMTEEEIQVKMDELIQKSYEHIKAMKDIPELDAVIEVEMKLDKDEWKVVMNPDLASCISGFYTDLIQDISEQAEKDTNTSNENQIDNSQNKEETQNKENTQN